jgi:hypothetical protein
MNKLKIFLNIFSVTALFFVLFYNPFYACKKYDNNTEIREVDTLIKWTATAGKMMIIDNDAIQKRADSIKMKLTLIDSSGILISNEQTLYELKEYRAMHLKYTTFLENYAALEFDNSIHNRFLEEFKKQVIDKKISKREVIKTINDKKPLIRKHLDDTKQLIMTIFSIEEMYKQINNKVNIIYEGIQHSRGHSRIVRKKVGIAPIQQ